jgi:broad specificity phosphatase PhoE
MLEFFIVRHGESIRNLACLLAHQGSDAVLQSQLADGSDELEWPLTEKGRAQAQAAGKWLAEHAGKIDAAYCSPYVRTVETAQNLHLRVEPQIDSRLREREWGDYPQGAYSVGDYLSDLASCSNFEWRSKFPGGESIHDLVPATASFLADLRAERPFGRVVIVTHGGRMQAMEYLIEGRDSKRKYANCCILQYRFEGDSTAVRVEYPAQPQLPPVPWQPVFSPVTIEV